MRKRAVPSDVKALQIHNNLLPIKMRNSTLVFLIKRDSSEKISEICLAMKKRGFGEGRWNGAGGKVQEGESLIDAAIREVKEEINVIMENLTTVAELKFYFPHQPDWDQLVTVYFVEDWMGEPSESEEMKPRWFKVSEIPYKEMWADDIIWLPKVLSGEFVNAEFVFGEGDVVLSHKFAPI